MKYIRAFFRKILKKISIINDANNEIDKSKSGLLFSLCNFLMKIFSQAKEKNFWINFWLWVVLFYHGFVLILAFGAMAFNMTVKMKMPNIWTFLTILFLSFNFVYLIRSAKDVLSGKERLWKVFCLWVVVLYFGGCFLMVYDLFQIKFDYLFPVLLTIYNFSHINLVILYDVMHINFILAPFLALILKKNFENLDIKNPYLRKITVFVPFMLVFLMCMTGFGFICLNIMFGVIGEGYLMIGIILIILLFLFYWKVFKNFHSDLKY